MNKVLVYVFLILLCCSCESENKIKPVIEKQLTVVHKHDDLTPLSDLDKSLLGRYAHNSSWNTGFFLNLFENQTFKYEGAFYGCTTGNDRSEIVDGCFTIEDNCLVLFPEDLISIRHNDRGVLHDDVRDTIIYVLNNNSYIETSFYIVEQNGIHFLLSDTYAKAFLSNYFSYRNSIDQFAAVYAEGKIIEKESSYFFVQHPLDGRKIDLIDFDTLQLPKEYRYLFKK